MRDYIIIAIVILVGGILIFFMGRTYEKNIWEDRLFRAESRVDTLWKDTTIYIPPSHGEIIGEPIPYDTIRFVDQIDSLIAEYDSLRQVVNYLAEPFSVTSKSPRYSLHINTYPVSKVVNYSLQLTPFVIRVPETLESVYIRVPYSPKWTEYLWRYLVFFTGGGLLALILTA